MRSRLSGIETHFFRELPILGAFSFFSFFVFVSATEHRIGPASVERATTCFRRKKYLKKQNIFVLPFLCHNARTYKKDVCMSVSPVANTNGGKRKMSLKY